MAASDCRWGGVLCCGRWRGPSLSECRRGLVDPSMVGGGLLCDGQCSVEYFVHLISELRAGGRGGDAYSCEGSDGEWLILWGGGGGGVSAWWWVLVCGCQLISA